MQADGKATAKLTGTAAGSVVVKATVNGATQTATVTVKENVYTITASPTTLTQLVSQEVTVTVMRNGSTEGSGTTVSVASNTALSVLAGNSTTDGGGQFKLTLTPTDSAATTETLSFTVDSKTVETSFTVTPIWLSLESDKTSLAGGEKATLTLSSNLPANTWVNWSRDASSTANGEFESSSTLTDADGKATVQLTAKDMNAGKITAKATVAGKSATKDIAVTATTYTLAAAPNTLTVNVPANVTFTVKKNGSDAGAGIQVKFTADTTNFTNLSTAERKTEGSGTFTVLGLTAKNTGSHTVLASVDAQRDTPVTFTVKTPGVTTVSFDSSTYNPSFSGSGASQKASQAVTITVKDSDGNPASGAAVTLSASMNDAANKAIVSGRRNNHFGLKVNGQGDPNGNFPAPFGLTTDSNGKVTVMFEDVVGQRTLTLTAKGKPSGGTEASATTTLTFGAGPLAVFAGAPVGFNNWADAATACGGTPGNPSLNAYQRSTNLPTTQQLKDVSGVDGASSSAGWVGGSYWSGQAGYGSANYVVLPGGNVSFDTPSTFNSMVCLPKP